MLVKYFTTIRCAISLGVHLEGPYINIAKKGAHPPHCISTFDNGIQEVENMYGSLDNAAMLTLAPEMKGSSDIIDELVQKGITVSLGKCGCVYYTGLVLFSKKENKSFFKVEIEIFKVHI